jgi:NADH-quinone oxidoreductase subunit N
MKLSLLLPEITLFCGALVILMLDVFFNKKKENFFYLSHFLALIFATVAAYFVVKNFAAVDLLFNRSFASGAFISFAKAIAVLLLIFIILISLEFVYNFKKISAEFLALLLISTSGGLILLSANDFLVFYLGLELQALPLYLLAALNRNSKRSSEAGMKYFILGSLASGILLFGISLIYGFSGTTNFAALSELYHFGDITAKGLVPVAVMFGFVLVIIAMFFKIAAAPFHMWAPDVYQGAPTMIASFFAVVVKFISLLVLIRIVGILILGWVGMEKIFLFTGILSIAIGSFGAIFQTNLKRLLAYSSVGHVGFILLALSAFSRNGANAAVLYSIIYAVISLGSFGFLNMVRSSNTREEGDENDDNIFAISSLSGLSKTNPVCAFALAVLMFSSAGIPPFAGFFSKFYVLTAIVDRMSLITAVIAVLLSVVSAFYYLRIIKIMYFDEPKNIIKLEDYSNIKAVMIVAALINIALIVFLKPFMELINNFMSF